MLQTTTQPLSTLVTVRRLFIGITLAASAFLLFTLERFPGEFYEGKPADHALFILGLKSFLLPLFILLFLYESPRRITISFEAPPFSRYPFWAWAGAALMAFYLMARIATPQINFGEGELGVGYGHDGVVYGQMVEHFKWFTREFNPPYCYKVLPAVLVRYSGLNTFQGFHLLNFISYLFTGFFMFKILRFYGADRATAAVGMFLFAGVKFGLKFWIYYPVLSDALGNALLLAIIYFSITRKYVGYVVAMTLGAYTRENLMILIPFHYLVCVRNRTNNRAFITGIFQEALPIALIVLSKKYPFFLPKSTQYTLAADAWIWFRNALLWRKLDLLAAHANTLGVLFPLAILCGSRTKKFLRAHYEWLYYIPATLAIGMASYDYDRYAVWQAPALLAALMWASKEYRPLFSLKVWMYLLLIHLTATELFLPWRPDEDFYLSRYAVHAKGVFKLGIGLFACYLFTLFTALYFGARETLFGEDVSCGGELSEREKSKLGFFLLAILLAANAFFLNFNAFRHFNILDMGAFMDAGWRILQGQVPYRDILHSTGPVHLYMLAFFFWIFGFGKAAILTHVVTVHSIVIALVFGMTRKRMPLWTSLSVTLLTTASFYWTSSHPWHDQSAHVWGLLGVGLLSFRLPFKNNRAAFWSGVFCGAASLTSFLTKSNVGTAYVITFLAVFLVSPNRWSAFSGYVLGVVLWSAPMLLLIRAPKEFFEQAVELYPKLHRDRFAYFLDGKKWLANYYWIPVTAVSAHFFATKKKPWALYTLFLGLAFIGIFSVLTGSMIKKANIVLWGPVCALGFMLLYERNQSEMSDTGIRLNRLSRAVLAGAVAVLTVLATCYGVELNMWKYDEALHKTPRYAIRANALKDWGDWEAEGQAIDRGWAFIHKYIPKNESLLILTDLNILYPLSGKTYPGLPSQWVPGALPAPGKYRKKIRDDIINHPPDWIITHVKFTSIDSALLYYLDLIDFIDKHYGRLGYFGENDKYVILKKLAPAA